MARRRKAFKGVSGHVKVAESTSDYMPGKRDGLQYCHRCGKIHHIMGLGAQFKCQRYHNLNNWGGPLWSQEAL